ncbi:MAG: hypothetical protein DRP74_06410, partial [Candidatus Omnitrophota bacterium]
MKKIIFSQRLAMLVFLCLGIIIYSQTFQVPFHFDDHFSIVSNLKIRDISNLEEIFDFWPTRFITYFTFAVNYHFGKLHVFG